LLLENGESVHDKLNRGRTALHLAVRRGHEALAKMLIENGASVHERSSSGEATLSMAVRAGNTAVVKLLLENGAEVQAITTKTENRDRNGITPLVLAVKNRHKDVVKILIDYGSIPEKISRRSNALISAIETKQEDIVTLLTEGGADVNQTPFPWTSFYYTPLHAAAKAGPAMTKLILQAKGDPEVETYPGVGFTPLSNAVRNPGEINNEVVRLLIEAGAKITP
jgi:ankyrin repeat protein